MRVILRVVLTLVITSVTLFTINILKHSESDYNTGLLAVIILAGSLAGVITIWSNTPKNLEAKTIE